MDGTMEKTNDDMMDIDIDGASGIIDMEPSTRPNGQIEESNEVKLTDLPKEMLEEILIYLNNEDMLRASHVCKSFASAAETAFARKYANKYYWIDASLTNKGFNKVMLNKYGGQMRRIGIKGGDKEILGLVEQKCRKLKSLSLFDVQRIIMMKNLKEVSIRSVRNWNHETFAEFINGNRQLETLQLMYLQEFDFTDILDDRLNKLKELKLSRIRNIIGLSRKIRLGSLETLRLDSEDSESYVRILQAMDCNKIKSLEVVYQDDQNQDADVIAEICKFETLVSLDLSLYRITSDEMRKLATHLPNIAELETGIAQDQSNPESMIQLMSSMPPKLTKYEATLDEDDFDQLVIELKKPSKEFYASFASSNTKIVLWMRFSESWMYITTDYFCIDSDGSIELHWMNNLSEKSVRKVLSDILWPSAVTFINSCSDRAFDISALAHVKACPYPDLDLGVQYLAFKSIGPISVNSNVSRYLDIFPNLKSLKIHLENHSANDYLRSLDAEFCKQIEELWLNAKGASDNGDMTHALAKFENLKSLLLAPSSVKFEADHLFSVCRHLTEIKRI